MSKPTTAIKYLDDGSAEFAEMMSREWAARAQYRRGLKGEAPDLKAEAEAMAEVVDLSKMPSGVLQAMMFNIQRGFGTKGAFPLDPDTEAMTDWNTWFRKMLVKGCSIISTNDKSDG